jgi:catalase
MPKPADAAKPTREDLKKSAALSIILNGPNNFKGRKLGVLVTEAVDMPVLKSLQSAAKKEGALVEIIALKVGGVTASDGSWIEAAQKVDGGPSVLYDAVVLLPSIDGARALAADPAARDFVADAFAHRKFIGYVEAAAPLFDKAGVANRDEGMIALKTPKDCSRFLAACGELRYWARGQKQRIADGEMRADRNPLSP